MKISFQNILFLAFCLSILSKNSYSQFGKVEEIQPSLNGEILFHDLDMDGDLDPIVIGDRTVRWYQNMGNLLFAPPETIIDAFKLIDYDVRYDFNNSPFLDFDGDGDLDFISTHGVNENNAR